VAIANGHDFMLGGAIFLRKELLSNRVCSGNTSTKHDQTESTHQFVSHHIINIADATDKNLHKRE